MVHREGEVVSTAHEETGARVRARLGDASVGRLRPYVVATNIHNDVAATPASTAE